MLTKKLGKTRWTLILVAVVLVFSAYMRVNIPRQTYEGADDYSYNKFALDMLDGKPFGGTYYWPPGMSLFLYAAYSLFGLDIKWLLILIGFLDSVLVYFIAKALSKDIRVAWLSFFISLLDVDLMYFSTQLYSENVYNLFFLTAVYCIIKSSNSKSLRYPALAGACIGLCTYQKVYTVGLIPIAFAHWWVNRKKQVKFFSRKNTILSKQ